MHRTVADLYPERPPGFVGRTPFGYHDANVIVGDLKAAGFETCAIHTVATTWSPSSPRDPAIAFCQGSPLRAEIEAADLDRPTRATEAATAAIVAHLGGRPPAFPMQARVIEATK